MNATKNKFCKDCKWCYSSFFHGMRDAECISPQSPKEFDKVTGVESYATKFCVNQREYNLNGLCGPEGKWFEAK